MTPPTRPTPAMPPPSPPRAGASAAEAAPESAAQAFATSVMQATWDVSPLAIAHVVNRTIVSANHAMLALFGYSASELVGRTTRCLFTTEHDFLDVARRYLPVLATGQTYRSDEHLVTRDGRVFWGNVYGKAIDPASPERGSIWIYDDISERIAVQDELRRHRDHLVAVNAALEHEMQLRLAAEQQRRQAEEQKKLQEAELARIARLTTMGEMVSTLAHELSQPLLATANYLSGSDLLLRSPNHDRDEVLKALAIAIRQNERAGEIIKYIKQFVRKQQPEKQLCDLNHSIREMVGFVDFEARAHEIQVELDLAPDLPELLLNPIEIEQVILNLTRNALEALAECPREQRLICVSTRLEAQHVLMQVCDWGPGVPAVHRNKVFEPFYSTKAQGTGFGLAICTSIIQAHGGRLWVEANPAGGAQFSCTLPIPATSPPNPS